MNQVSQSVIFLSLSVYDGCSVSLWGESVAIQRRLVQSFSQARRPRAQGMRSAVLPRVHATHAVPVAVDPGPGRRPLIDWHTLRPMAPSTANNRVRVSGF